MDNEKALSNKKQKFWIFPIKYKPRPLLLVLNSWFNRVLQISHVQKCKYFFHNWLKVNAIMTQR